ncbi:Hypothetical predicted protein [Pelobates cultripes]|uniref:Uncharacterized protein n=1 Tax=Pelobates cultripes TaxID=61616 RepID=A0AAD1SC64_PELCU|nr:Hypothetical predicted protein [Pelobates cultripes]
MAVQRGPHKPSIHTQPTSNPLGEFDRFCASLWTLLSDRGMTYRLAVKLVATWMRPVTRRRYYRHPPQATRTAARPCKSRRAQRCKTPPSSRRKHTGPHTHENETTKAASHISYSPATGTGVQQSSPPCLQVTAANRGAAWLNTPLNTTGAGPRRADAFKETNVDSKRHVHALGIG